MNTEVAAILRSCECFISSSFFFFIFLLKEKCKEMVSTNGNATDFTALCKFRQLASALCVRPRSVPGVLGRGEQHVTVRHNSRPAERISKGRIVFIRQRGGKNSPNPVLLGLHAPFPPGDRPCTEPQLPSTRLQLFQTSPLLSK